MAQLVDLSADSLSEACRRAACNASGVSTSIATASPAGTSTTAARTGLTPELRLYRRGQGYDLVERPLIRRDETVALAANVNLAVHAGVRDAGGIRRYLRQLHHRPRRTRRLSAQDREEDF